MRRETASLTKMMNALVCLKLAKSYRIDIKTEMVTICDVASDIRGTSAFLRKGDILSVEQLLLGMMLPSGNDAAFALAKYFGKMIFRNRNYGDKERA